MSPVPASRPRPGDIAKPIDDFEWPPTGDELSVYEMGPEPWQTRQVASRPVSASSPVPASRPVTAARPVSAARQRELSLPQQRRPAQPAAGTAQKLVAVLAASAMVAAAAGCVLYGAMARPVPVRAVHHPAPPAVAPPPPPATPDAAPIDAPADEEPATGASDTIPPSSEPAEPAAVDPRTDGH